MNKRIAILLDGGFVRPLLFKATRRRTDAAAIETLCGKLMAHPKISGFDLYRIFYYDCKPFAEKVTNPISREDFDYRDEDMTKANLELMRALELRENFAVRTGALIKKGW